MKLEHLAVPTEVMHSGMTLRNFFEECVRCHVPGLPYVDDQNRITGRLSIRHVYKYMAIPEDLLIVVDAMGDQTDNFDLSEMEVFETLELPLEKFLLENIPTVTPRSSVVKALALMEVHNSSYIFLVDEEKYLGVVTRMVIASRMLECVSDIEQKKHSALEK